MDLETESIRTELGDRLNPVERGAEFVEAFEIRHRISSLILLDKLLLFDKYREFKINMFITFVSN